MYKYLKLRVVGFLWGFIVCCLVVQSPQAMEVSDNAEKNLCAGFPVDLCLSAVWAATVLFPHVHLRDELLAQEREYDQKSWLGKVAYNAWHGSIKPYGSNIFDQPRERLKRFAHSGLQKDLWGHEPAIEFSDRVTLQLQQEVVKRLYGDKIDTFLDDHIPYVVTQLANEKRTKKNWNRVPWYAKAAIVAPQVLQSVALIAGAARFPAVRARRFDPSPVRAPHALENEAHGKSAFENLSPVRVTQIVRSAKAQVLKALSRAEANESSQKGFTSSDLEFLRSIGIASPDSPMSGSPTSTGSGDSRGPMISRGLQLPTTGGGGGGGTAVLSQAAPTQTAARGSVEFKSAPSGTQAMTVAAPRSPMTAPQSALPQLGHLILPRIVPVPQQEKAATADEHNSAVGTIGLAISDQMDPSRRKQLLDGWQKRNVVTSTPSTDSKAAYATVGGAGSNGNSNGGSVHTFDPDRLKRKKQRQVEAAEIVAKIHEWRRSQQGAVDEQAVKSFLGSILPDHEFISVTPLVWESALAHLFETSVTLQGSAPGSNGKTDRWSVIVRTTKTSPGEGALLQIGYTRTFGGEKSSDIAVAMEESSEVLLGPETRKLWSGYGPEAAQEWQQRLEEGAERYVSEFRSNGELFTLEGLSERLRHWKYENVSVVTSLRGDLSLRSESGLETAVERESELFKFLAEINVWKQSTPEIEGKIAFFVNSEAPEKRFLLLDLAVGITRAIWLNEAEPRVSIISYDQHGRLRRVSSSQGADDVAERMEWLTGELFFLAHPAKSMAELESDWMANELAPNGKYEAEISSEFPNPDELDAIFPYTAIPKGPLPIIESHELMQTQIESDLHPIELDDSVLSGPVPPELKNLVARLGLPEALFFELSAELFAYVIPPLRFVTEKGGGWIERRIFWGPQNGGFRIVMTFDYVKSDGEVLWARIVEAKYNVDKGEIIRRRITSSFLENDVSIQIPQVDRIVLPSSDRVPPRGSRERSRARPSSVRALSLALPPPQVEAKPGEKAQEHKEQVQYRATGTNGGVVVGTMPATVTATIGKEGGPPEGPDDFVEGEEADEINPVVQISEFRSERARTTLDREEFQYAAARALLDKNLPVPDVFGALYDLAGTSGRFPSFRRFREIVSGFTNIQLSAAEEVLKRGKEEQALSLAREIAKLPLKSQVLLSHAIQRVGFALGRKVTLPAEIDRISRVLNTDFIGKSRELSSLMRRLRSRGFQRVNVEMNAQGELTGAYVDVNQVQATMRHSWVAIPKKFFKFLREAEKQSQVRLNLEPTEFSNDPFDFETGRVPAEPSKPQLYWNPKTPNRAFLFAQIPCQQLMVAEINLAVGESGSIQEALYSVTDKGFELYAYDQVPPDATLSELDRLIYQTSLGQLYAEGPKGVTAALLRLWRLSLPASSTFARVTREFEGVRAGALATFPFLTERDPAQPRISFRALLQRLEKEAGPGGSMRKVGFEDLGLAPHQVLLRSAGLEKLRESTNPDDFVRWYVGTLGSISDIANGNAWRDATADYVWTHNEPPIFLVDPARRIHLLFYFRREPVKPGESPHLKIRIVSPIVKEADNVFAADGRYAIEVELKVFNSPEIPQNKRRIEINRGAKFFPDRFSPGLPMSAQRYVIPLYP